MIRVSTTHLDKFERVRRGDLTPAQFVAEIINPPARNEAMAVGVAFEHVLYHGLSEADGVVWDASLGQWAVAVGDYPQPIGFDPHALKNAMVDFAALAKGAGSQPVWQEKVTMQRDGVELVGKLDLILGGLVVDIKTTKYKPNPAWYMDSWQWKVYAHMVGAPAFEYWVWQVARSTVGYKPKDVTVVKCWPYAGMDSEIFAVLQDVRAFAEQHPELYVHLERKHLDAKGNGSITV